MNVSLTTELEKMVNEKVASGRYGSASEVIREALRLMDERDHQYSRRIEDLRLKVAEAEAQFNQGLFVTPEELTERINEMSRKARAKKKKE